MNVTAEIDRLKASELSSGVELAASWQMTIGILRGYLWGTWTLRSARGTCCACLAGGRMRTFSSCAMGRLGKSEVWLSKYELAQHGARSGEF